LIIPTSFFQGKEERERKKENPDSDSLRSVEEMGGKEKEKRGKKEEKERKKDDHLLPLFLNE